MCGVHIDARWKGIIRHTGPFYRVSMPGEVKRSHTRHTGGNHVTCGGQCALFSPWVRPEATDGQSGWISTLQWRSESTWGDPGEVFVVWGWIGMPRPPCLEDSWLEVCGIHWQEGGGGAYGREWEDLHKLQHWCQHLGSLCPGLTPVGRYDSYRSKNSRNKQDRGGSEKARCSQSEALLYHQDLSRSNPIKYLLCCNLVYFLLYV